MTGALSTATLGTGRFVGEYAPGTDDWAALRARRVGGSEVAAVVGLSPWESYFGLWHRKVGNLDPVAETDIMWWGTAIEPAVAARYAHLHPDAAVLTAGTYVSRDRNYQLISPDRVIRHRDTGDLELLELKLGHTSDEWGDDGTDEIPVHYRCQLIWAMDTLGFDSHRLAVYMGGDTYREYLVKYDPDDAAILRARAEAFLAHVDAGEPLPDIDGHAATYQAVRELNPAIDPVDVEVPARLAEPYLAALEAAAECEVEKRRPLPSWRSTSAGPGARSTAPRPRAGREASPAVCPPGTPNSRPTCGRAHCPSRPRRSDDREHANHRHRQA